MEAGRIGAEPVRIGRVGVVAVGWKIEDRERAEGARVRLDE